jgi:hypothetical protein
MMTKSEKISCQFESVLMHLELADSMLHKINEIEAGPKARAMEMLQELLVTIEELHYETVSPIQMKEFEKEQEIELLEKRLAELRAE